MNKRNKKKKAGKTFVETQKKKKKTGPGGFQNRKMIRWASPNKNVVLILNQLASKCEIITGYVELQSKDTTQSILLPI